MGIDLCLGVFALVHLTILDARYVKSILKDVLLFRGEPLKGVNLGALGDQTMAGMVILNYFPWKFVHCLGWHFSLD